MIAHILHSFASFFTRLASGYDKLRADMLLGAVRSPRWGKVRRLFLRDNPVCAVCGTGNDLDVHHLIPLSRAPSLELENTNLITLCRPHHFLCGHLMSWFSYSDTCRSDVAYFAEKIAKRP